MNFSRGFPALVLLSCLVAAASLAKEEDIVSESQYSATSGAPIPQSPREFRAVWISTVANIDWPSAPGLSTQQQKRQLIAILDKVKALRMNAVVFQVRPNCDALYASSMEPWSYYLTGKMGQAPNPYYDPLEFAVEEAHKRGLELHAWFNPFRALHPASKNVSSNHISKTHPEMVRKVGRYLWLDPGMKEAREYSLRVILDVVRRYDIDGIQIDDYFYPYPEYLEGHPFPDAATYEAYRKSGGKLDLGDWRRHNINQFVERLYEDTKKLKPWVKVGISPFGIWRPNNPRGIQGFDAYSSLYADAKLWLNRGWVDYFSPQLYWSLSSPQPYRTLLKWWVSQNRKGRHIWPGLGAHRLQGSYHWSASELVNQVKATREQAGASGNIFFSAKELMLDTKGIDEALLKGVYNYPALIPASPWLSSSRPSAPRIEMQHEPSGKTIVSAHEVGKRPFLWAVYSREGESWRLTVFPADENRFVIGTNPRDPLPTVLAVSAIDRTGNESPRTVLLPSQTPAHQ